MKTVPTIRDQGHCHKNLLTK